jgi:hypothetical protein
MIERTYDYRKVKKLIPDDESFAVSSDIIYLVDGDNIWVIEPDEDLPQIHVNMSEDCRGKEAVKKCKQVIKWVFKNTSIDTLYGVIDKTNKAACHNAIHVGMAFSHETRTKRIYEVSYG